MSTSLYIHPSIPPQNHGETVELKDVHPLTSPNDHHHHHHHLPLTTPLGIPNSQSFQLDIDDGYADETFRPPPALPRQYTMTSSASSHVTSGAPAAHSPSGAHHGYIPSTVVRRRSSSSHGGGPAPVRRRRLLSHFRQKAKSIKVKIPSVQDVNTIDKYSRLLFPLLFVIFNASYWMVYLLT